MKSEYEDRKTIGSQIVETQQKHEESTDLDVLGIVDQFGKQYMKDLINYIETGSKKYDIFYINILSRITKQFNKRALEVFPYIQPALPMMQPNQDVWKINCKTQKFELLWTLPDVSEFDIVLANPNKDNEKLIHWINIYKDLRKKAADKKIKSVKKIITPY